MIGELLVASPRILENPVKAHIQVGGAAERSSHNGDVDSWLVTW